jgi:hypothetical protein
MTKPRSMELADLIVEGMKEGGKPVPIEPSDWPIIAQALSQCPVPDNFARLLHRAVLNNDGTMTVHIPVLKTTQDAKAHVAAFRLIARQFIAEFCLVTQKSFDDVFKQLIHELHIERKAPIGEKPEYEGPVIELPPGVQRS